LYLFNFIKDRLQNAINVFVQIHIGKSNKKLTTP